MFKRLKNIKRATLIKNSFLIPILSVVVMSISHVISWYDIGNPFSWAIYLSVAIEVFALASVSAASINIKKGSIWALFILVTLIQIVGNVYFTFQEIDVTSESFKSWVELISPLFEDYNIIDHRRFLSYIQGGTLPFMSLIALHFYIVFNENLKNDGEFEKENVQNENLNENISNADLDTDSEIQEKTQSEDESKKEQEEVSENDEKLVDLKEQEIEDEDENEAKKSQAIESVNKELELKKEEKPNKSTNHSHEQYSGRVKRNKGGKPGPHPQRMPGVN